MPNLCALRLTTSATREMSKRDARVPWAALDPKTDGEENSAHRLGAELLLRAALEGPDGR
jgi:hypothetical protein